MLLGVVAWGARGAALEVANLAGLWHNARLYLRRGRSGAAVGLHVARVAVVVVAWSAVVQHGGTALVAALCGAWIGRQTACKLATRPR
jgi:hypothetical protein